MVYIVMDLEWTQSSEGKAGAVPGMPFEVIEIGAVKLKEDRNVISCFQRLIKPRVYKKLHYAARELLHIKEQDLENGGDFPAVMEEFLLWCRQEGEEYRFCTWGSMDLMELQRNCHYYEMDSCFSIPLFYYDLQKIFSIEYAGGKESLSLEHAVELLGLKKQEDFHRALTDAEYTAEILKKLSPDKLRQYYSVDYYHAPLSRKQEIQIEFPGYVKHVFQRYETREKALKDRAARIVRCPLCGKRAARKIRWYSNNMKNYYSLSECKEHGFLRGKLHVRKTDGGDTYIVKTIRRLSGQEAQDMKDCCRKQRERKKKHKAIK